MKPVADNVLIAEALGEFTTDYGSAGSGLSTVVGGRIVEGSKILRPETSDKTKPCEGVVMALGDDVTIKIAEGDRVLFRPWTGIEVTLNGEPVIMTPQKNVLAVVEISEQVLIK